MEQRHVQFVFDREHDVFIEYFNDEPIRVWPHKEFGRYLSMAFELYEKVEMEGVAEFVKTVRSNQEMREEAKQLIAQLDAQFKEKLQQNGKEQSL